MDINNLDIVGMIKPQKQTYLYDEAASEVIFKEIFLKVALDDWDNFKKLCDLPLPWFNDFSLQRSYELSGSREEPDLSDQGALYPNFFNAAATYFPDKYAKYILEKMLPQIEQSPSAKSNFIREKTYVLNDLLKSSKNETLNFLCKHGLTNNQELIKEIFYNYHEYRDLAIEIMKNKETHNYLFEVNNLHPNTKTIELIFNKCNLHYEKHIEILSNHLEDLYMFMPEKKNDINNIVINYLDRYKRYDGLKEEAQKVLKSMLIKGYFDIHSIYLASTKKLLSNEDEENLKETGISIEKYYNLKKEFIEEVYTKKAELLNEKLNNSSTSKKHVVKL